jgi:rhamnose utilization protein RhaD (predicted bifunctional aldolase and dehydrogenase)/NAD(P)-dependent dehydrogenase (short-subunit alcohol dehydrogenase family)
MKSRYDEAEAARYVQKLAHVPEDLALRVYTSRLLGSDPALVLHGGGNTSVKAVAKEVTGEPVDVLYVKGSGWDLASIEPRGFPGCRLEPLRRAAELEDLSDERMVQLLRGQMLDASSPTPSVEALLHAYVPGKFVDHTHADAVLSVVDQPDAEEHARRVWGDGLLFVPYVVPGFVLARAIVALRASLPRASVMVLDKHGIFTWGQTAKQSYERMIEAVSAAERYIESRREASGRVSVMLPSLQTAERRHRQRAISLAVRGALYRADDGQRLLLGWRDEPEILELLARDDAAIVTQVGTATPDHVIRTKPTPLFVGEAPEGDDLASVIERRLSEYARWYESYVERSKTSRARDVTRLDRLPRILLFPGLGALCVGKTKQDVNIAGDIWWHTSIIIQDAQLVGSYRPVAELDLFDVEYWSLEQAKLGLSKGRAAPLERHIALVTGAASGIGRATAAHLLELGAHVLLCDRDGERLSLARRELSERFGTAVANYAADVTDEQQVADCMSAVVDAFGGLDIVVSNAGTAPTGRLHEAEGQRALEQSLAVNLLGHQYVARHASRMFLAQGSGGCLLFNASKSAFNQGPEFGPYAVPKAALIALMRQYAVDMGPFGVRSNAVNADRIRTDLFGSGVLEARARARGVSPDVYFRQNLLGRETTADDVASAFGWLATAGATTGAVITVDGGNPAAFPR